MLRFDEHDVLRAQSIARLNQDQFDQVRATVLADLNRGLDGWPAITWLAATHDRLAKGQLIDELLTLIDGASSALMSHEAAADNFSSDVVFGRAARERRRVSRAFDFVTALRRSMHSTTEVTNATEIESRIERKRHDAAVQEQREAHLASLGVQPGAGLPFWELYMRRRRHKSWGS